MHFYPVHRHANAYFTLVNVLVLPGDCFLPCLLTITGSFFGAKYGHLKRILPVCILLSIICMQFSGLALAWLHKAASTLKACGYVMIVYGLIWARGSFVTTFVS